MERLNSFIGCFISLDRDVASDDCPILKDITSICDKLNCICNVVFEDDSVTSDYNTNRIRIVLSSDKSGKIVRIARG